MNLTLTLSTQSHFVFRNKNRSWVKVLLHFIQFCSTLFCTFSVIRRFVVSNFQNFGKDPIFLKDLLYILSMGHLVGTLAFLAWWYGLLHCWLNMWAELLRFADRQFYDDWWTTSSFHNYYRKWNLVVHDWLYSYSYAPLCNVI